MEAVAFDDSNWEAANLPHGLEILGENASGGRNYQGKAWYRKRFSVDNPDGNRVYLYFEAVMGEARVWVNGKHVAEHFGGYLPFAADITDVINKDGKSNVIAVMADNSDSTLYPPGQRQGRLDFTYFGGIYRDTYLIQTGPVHVTLPELSKTVAGGGVFVATLDVNGNNAKMEVRTELENSSKSGVKLTVRSTLENADGKEVAAVEESIDLKAGEKRQLSKQFDVKGVRLWHPDDPYLHYLRTDLVVNGKVVDSMRTRVGVRLFEMRGAEGLFVNKKWIGKKLVGANRHQDYVYVGNALPNSGQWRDVKLLRQGGCNVIRAGHYPQDPAFYDACDEFGMLTTTANPGWHFFNFKDKIFEKRLYDDTRQLVRRDRNVASMLMWETAINECPKQPDYAMNTMHKIAHEEFPFPGMYTVADHDEAKKGGLDIYYHGNSKDVNSFTREFGDGSEVDNWYSQNAVTRVKSEWGEKALLGQSLRLADTLKFIFITPKVRLGGSLWCGIEHQRGYHVDPFRGGLLNVFRLPKYSFYVYGSQYDPDYKIPGVKSGPMIFNAHEITQVSSPDVVIFSNCEEIRLSWLGKTYTGKPSNEARFKGLPYPPFIFKDVFNFYELRSKSGKGKVTNNLKMIAEGLIGGKVVVRDEKDYAERNAGLKLSVSDEGMALVADGSDFVPVRAAVIDQNGTKKVLSSEFVYFEVEGDAEIIGGSFNQANPVKSEMGVASALLRAGVTPGEIKVTAHASGLKSDMLTIKTVAPITALVYDKEYTEASVKPAKDAVVIMAGSKDDDLPKDVKALQEELKMLRLEMVGKDQTIMELRSTKDD